MSIALDRVDLLESVPCLGPNAINIDERQHRLANRLSEVFEVERIMMLMLAREVFVDRVIEGDN